MHAGILSASITLFDVLLQIHLLQTYLLDDRQAGKPRPLIAKMQHFVHFIDELRIRVVVPPATGIGKFDEALLRDFEEHGEGAIKIARIERPTEYLKLIASRFPIEFQFTDSRLKDLSDDELDAFIAHIRSQLGGAAADADRGEDQTLN